MKPSSNIRLIPFFVLLLIVVAIPLTVYIAQQQQTLQQQAQTINSGRTKISPSISLQQSRIQTTGTLGNNAIGRFFDTAAANNMSGSKFTMGNTTKNIVSMSVYIGNIDSLPHNLYMVAIYLDEGGSPTQLISHSQTNVLQQDSWNTAALSATLQAGKSYWFMYNTNGSNIAVNNMRYQSANSSQMAWGTNGQSFGIWPTYFGPVSKQHGIFSIYVTFQ